MAVVMIGGAGGLLALHLFSLVRVSSFDRVYLLGALYLLGKTRVFALGLV